MVLNPCAYIKKQRKRRNKNQQESHAGISGGDYLFIYLFIWRESKEHSITDVVKEMKDQSM